MKQVRLTLEAQAVIKKMDNDQLSYLSSIGTSSKFQIFKDLVNLLIDQEKNMFFGDDESKYDDSTWRSKHAYARGGIAKLIMLIHIIYGSQAELNRREEERKKLAKK